MSLASDGQNVEWTATFDRFFFFKLFIPLNFETGKFKNALIMLVKCSSFEKSLLSPAVLGTFRVEENQTH